MNCDRFLLILILLLQLFLFGGLVLVYEQIDRRVLTPMINAADVARDATTALTQGPIRGAMSAAQHLKTVAVWSKLSGLVRAGAEKLRGNEL